MRDRRTLFFLLAPPFILPGIALVAAGFIGAQALSWSVRGFPVAVVNPEAAPELAEWLEDDKSLDLVEPPDGDDWGEVVVILALPDDFRARVENEQTAYVTLTTRDGAWMTALAAASVRGAIQHYGNVLVDRRLESRNLARAWLNPVVIGQAQAPTEGVAQPVALGGASGGGGDSALAAIFLPLAVTSWLVGGGLGLIVDTTVGEKERRTIEALLLTPASRLGIVAGKLATVFIASIVVMSLWLAEGVALSVLGSVGPAVLAAQEGHVDLTQVILQSGGQMITLALFLLLLVLPFIVTLNSLVMAWCTFASSYRESNVFLFLLQLALPAMVLLAVFSLPPEAGMGWYLLPLLGTVVAIRDLFSGVLLPGGLAVSVFVGLIYSVLSLALAAYVYSREWALVRGL